MSKLPKKIKCTCCHKFKAVREPVLMKRIKKAGSLQELLDTYLCRECRTEVTERTAKIVKNIKQQPTINKSHYEFKNLAANFKDEVTFLTSHTCLRPNLALAGNCGTCPFVEKCTVKDSKGNMYKTVRVK